MSDRRSESSRVVASSYSKAVARNVRPRNVRHGEDRWKLYGFLTRALYSAAVIVASFIAVLGWILAVIVAIPVVVWISLARARDQMGALRVTFLRRLRAVPGELG